MALCVLGDIAFFGTLDQLQLVVDSGAVRTFVQLLSSPYNDICEQVILVQGFVSCQLALYSFYLCNLYSLRCVEEYTKCISDKVEQPELHYLKGGMQTPSHI